MDSIYKYFIKEKAWLEEAGEDFADANPGLETYLRGGGKLGDPHVDRILEGTAFLAARLDKRLDESLRKVAVDLLSITFPELMAPQPSMTLVQYNPRKALREVKSAPIGCQFSVRSKRSSYPKIRLLSCDPVEFNVITVLCVTVDDTPVVSQSRVNLVLGPKWGSGLAAKDPLPSSLPILLYWDNLADSCHVYHGLLHQPEPIGLKILDSSNSYRELTDELSLSLRSPNEFMPLLPAGSRAFPGFRRMREFFALPERFLVLDIHGLDSCEHVSGAKELEIAITLPIASNKLPPIGVRNFLLNTTGACNRYQDKAMRITLDGTREREQILPPQEGEAIIGVKAIRALRRGTDAYIELPEFNYYDRDEPCYSVNSENYILSEHEQREKWFLEVNNIAIPGQHVLISTDLELCHSRAHEILGSASALDNYDEVPDELSGKIISRNSKFVPALNNEGRYWQLVDMTSCNLTSFSDPKRLQVFLQHLNRTEHRVVSKAISGIRTSDLTMTTTTLQQQPIKLANMTIGIKPNDYPNIGFIELFFSIMYSFMQDYVPLNCMLELIVRNVDNEEILCRWKSTTVAMTKG